MLEHLEAGDQSERGRLRLGKGFRRRAFVADGRIETRLDGMQLRDGQRAPGHVDAGDLRTEPGQALRQDAAAAADVRHPRPRESAALLEVRHAHRVDVVQGLEVPVRIPPAMRQRLELRDLAVVDVVVGAQLAILAGHSRARARTRGTSSVWKRPSS